MRKKLLLLVPSLAIGGQERQAVTMASCLADEYDVSIVVFNTVAPCYNPECAVLNLNLPPRKGWAGKAIQQLCRAYKLYLLRKKERPTAVFSFGATANLSNVLSRKFGRSFVSVRQYAETSNTALYRYIYKTADQIVCQTEAMRDLLIRNYPAVREKTQIIYNAYNIYQIKKLAQRPPDVVLPKNPYILAVGRMAPIKGFRQLLRAFALLHEKVPDVDLMLCGDGEIMADVKKLIEELGLHDNVICPGITETPYAYMSRCSIFVLPSIHEGCPNTLIEAMICGAPVIAADCKTGPREILSKHYIEKTAVGIEYADYGILLPPFTSDTSNEPKKTKLLAEAMEQMVTKVNLRKRYALLAVERGTMFSADAFRKAILSTIENRKEA